MTNVNVTMKVVGFDKNQKLVTESSDCTIESSGTFQARLSDPKKEIRFLKVMLSNKIREVAQRDLPSTPVAAVHTDASIGSLFVALLVAGTGIVLLWLFVKLISSFSNNAPVQSVPVPPPTANESAEQTLALADLAKGNPPHRFQLEGFLPKKGESVVWAFLSVKHYRKGLIRNGLDGALARASEFLRGSGFVLGPVADTRFLIPKWTTKGSEHWS